MSPYGPQPPSSPNTSIPSNFEAQRCPYPKGTFNAPGLHVGSMPSGDRTPYFRNRSSDTFDREFDEGRHAIVSWYEEATSRNPCASSANMAMSAKTPNDVIHLFRRNIDASIGAYGATSKRT